MIEFKRITKPEVEAMLLEYKRGFPNEKLNKKIFTAAIGYWTSFQNWKKHPPLALCVEGVPRAVSMFTVSNKTGLANFYFTICNEPGKGYGTLLWREFYRVAVAGGAKELKISSEPEALGFWLKQHLVFWGVDKTGSLRSRQPMSADPSFQSHTKFYLINDPTYYLSNLPMKTLTDLVEQNIDQLKEKDKPRTQAAIEACGKAWLRPQLLKYHNECQLRI